MVRAQCRGKQQKSGKTFGETGRSCRRNLTSFGLNFTTVSVSAISSINSRHSFDLLILPLPSPMCPCQGSFQLLLGLLVPRALSFSFGGRAKDMHVMTWCRPLFPPVMLSATLGLPITCK